MQGTKVLFIEVDTNDGDYEEQVCEVTEGNESEIKDFITLLLSLKTKESDMIRFEAKVGHDRYDNYCGLKYLQVGEGEWEEGLWTKEEVAQEGMITPEEYTLLEKYLPMYCEGGFHSVVTIDVRVIYKSEIVHTYL